MHGIDDWNVGRVGAGSESWEIDLCPAFETKNNHP